MRKRGGGIQEFKDTHRAVDPLHFVLLYLRGTDGWSPYQIFEPDEYHGGWDDYEAKMIACTKYYKYRLMRRRDETNYFHLSRRLLQEYVCIYYPKAEQQRFNCVEMNQDKLRANVYKNVVDHFLVAGVEVDDIDKQIILPATHPGSPRDMNTKFRDAIAICSKYGKGKIDFFVTVTRNPNWREVQEHLLPGQKAEDRQDFIARVFNLKLKAIEQELYNDVILGKCGAHLRVIEFQKRELPHAHILIILHETDRIKTVEQVDQIVSAEIPPHPNTIFDEDPQKQQHKREQAQKLQDLVLKNMVHGPCRSEKPNSPCMYNRDGDFTQVCSKKFPKEFVKETVYDANNSNVKYKRRMPQDGRSEAFHDGRVLDS